jgi:hypothetical protein
MSLELQIKAVKSLEPLASFAIEDGYDTLQWFSEDIQKPSREQFEEAYKNQIAFYKLNEYQILRKDSYPSIEAQLDVLYHEGYDGWKTMIKQIKDKFPKE